MSKKSSSPLSSLNALERFVVKSFQRRQYFSPSPDDILKINALLQSSNLRVLLALNLLEYQKRTFNGVASLSLFYLLRLAENYENCVQKSQINAFNIELLS